MNLSYLWIDFLQHLNHFKFLKILFIYILIFILPLKIVLLNLFYFHVYLLLLQNILVYECRSLCLP